MEVEITLKNGVKGTFSGEVKEVWRQLAEFQEIFGNDTCGKCSSNNVNYEVRTAVDEEGEKFEFFEMKCQDCYSRLSFGTPKENNQKLFPKRYETNSKGKAVKGEDGRGKYLPNNGWMKYGEV